MTKVYRVSKEEKKNDIITFIVGIIVYALVLMMASSLFVNFYIESFHKIL